MVVPFAVIARGVAKVCVLCSARAPFILRDQICCQINVGHLPRTVKVNVWTLERSVRVGSAYAVMMSRRNVRTSA